jgi:hypothetical protein
MPFQGMLMRVKRVDAIRRSVSVYQGRGVSVCLIRAVVGSHLQTLVVMNYEGWHQWMSRRLFVLEGQFRATHRDGEFDFSLQSRLLQEMHVFNDSIGPLTDAMTGLIPGQVFFFPSRAFSCPSSVFIAPHVKCELVERLALQSSPSHEPCLSGTGTSKRPLGEGRCFVWWLSCYCSVGRP